MNEPRYVLMHDVHSYKGKLYAVKGDVVSCIAKHGSIWIVKTATGKKFSVRAEQLDIL